MSETIQSWLERAAACPDVLACGVRLADRAFIVKSCREEYSEALLTQAMRDLSEAVYALQQNHIAAERLRWTFENGLIRCGARPGGVTAALVVSKEMAESASVERLLGDFLLALP